MKTRKLATYRSFRVWLAKEYNIASLKVPSRQSILSMKHMDIPQEEYIKYVEHFKEKYKEYVAALRKAVKHHLSSKEVALQKQILISTFQKEIKK